MPSTKSATKSFRQSQLTAGINSTASPDDLHCFVQDSQRTGRPWKGMEFRDIENFYPIDRGGLHKVPGFSLYYSTGNSAPITGITRYINNNTGVNQFIYSQGTHVYKLVSGTATSIANVANVSPIYFCEGNNLLVICDGVNQTQWYNGSTTTANSNASLPTATISPAFFQNRFWFLTKNAPNQSNNYFSAPNDITTGYGDATNNGGFVQCDYNDGDVCLGQVSTFLNNTGTPVLAVTKNRKLGVIQPITVSAVTGSGVTYAFAALDLVIGAASSQGLCRVGQDVYYFNQLGLSSGKTQYLANQLLLEYLSVNVSNQFNTTNIATLNNSILFYDWKNYRVCVAINETGYSYPNVLWCYDIRLNSWYKERWGNPNNITAAFVDTDGTFYHGDSNGNIYVHGPQYSTFNNAAISSYFTLPYIAFDDPVARKRLKLMTATLTGGAKVPVTVSHSLDYGDRTTANNTLPSAQTAYVWGGGVWTNNPAVYQWGAGSIANRRFWPQAYFRTISSMFSHADTSNNLEVFNLSWDVEYTSHR